MKYIQGIKKINSSIIFMLLYCLVMSAVTILLKIMQSDYHITQLMLMYNILICVLLAIIKIFNKKCIISCKNIKYHFLRSVFGFTGFSLFCYSFYHINITEVKAIMTLDPVFTTMLAIYFYKESITLNKVIALVITLIGAIIIFHPRNIDLSIYSITSLAAAFSYGLYNNLTKKITDGGIFEQRFYLSFFSAIFSLLPAIYFWRNTVAIIDVACIIVIACLFIISSFSIFIAFKKSDLSLLMPLHFIGIVITAIMGFLVFNETITYRTIIGSSIIIIGSFPVFIKTNLKKISS